MRTSAMAPEAPKGATQDPARDAPAGPRAQRAPARRVHAWWQGSEGGPGATTHAAGSDPRDEERAAPAVIRALESTGPGRALPAEVRAPLEASMGADFRDVRVHTGLEAQRLTGRFDARAFAVGRHVAFAPGAYAPYTGQGRYVLAHELAHIVQQSRGGAGSHGGEEASADRAATLVVSGGEARVVGGAAPHVACYPNDSRPAVSLTGDEPPVGDADPERQSDAELEGEVHALRAWLRRHNANNEAHHQATQRVQALERVVHERQPHAFRYGDTVVRWGIVRAAGTVVTYAAVPPGGRALADVASYLYGGADAVARLLQDNPNLPEQLPAGLGVRVNTSALARVARGSLERARRNELILLTDAVPTASDGDATTVSTTWQGRHVTLTQAQYGALLDHEASRVRLRVHALQDEIRSRVENHFRLAPHGAIELIVQELSDRESGQTRPSEDLWLRPLGRLTAATLPRRGNRLVEPIARAWLVVADVTEELRHNVATFDAYLDHTIAGGQAIISRLETARDVAFATAAALAGGAAVAAVVGGGTLPALMSWVALKGLAAGTVAGATAYAGLEATTSALGEVAATREHEHIDGHLVGERALHGLQHGAAIGAASALEALLVARFSFAFANETGGVLLTRIRSLSPESQHQLIELLSQVPGATARSLLENLPAVLNGTMSTEQWLALAEHDARAAAVGVGLRRVLGALLRTNPRGTRTNPASGEQPGAPPTATPLPTATPPAAVPLPPPPPSALRTGAREMLTGAGSAAIVDAPALYNGEISGTQYAQNVLTSGVMGGAFGAARGPHGSPTRTLRQLQESLVRGTSPQAHLEAQVRMTRQLRRRVGARTDVEIDPHGGTGIHVTEGPHGRVIVRVGAEATAWHLEHHIESAQVAHRALARPASAPRNRLTAAAGQWLQRRGYRSTHQHGGQARQDIRKLGNMVVEAEAMIGELQARHAAGRGTPEEAATLTRLMAERQSYLQQIEVHRQHVNASEERPIRISANGEDQSRPGGLEGTPPGSPEVAPSQREAQAPGQVRPPNTDPSGAPPGQAAARPAAVDADPSPQHGTVPPVAPDEASDRPTANPLREAEPRPEGPAAAGPSGEQTTEQSAEQPAHPAPQRGPGQHVGLGVLSHPMHGWDDAQLRSHLGPIAQSAWNLMRQAHANDARTVRLPDGTTLRVSDSGRGPCLSLAVDTVTGRVFYGQNTGVEPTNLAEPLLTNTRNRVSQNQARSPAPPHYPEGWSRRAGIPGSHSEVHAVNKALIARPGAQLGEIAIYNIRTEDIGLPAAPEMPRCTNCVSITTGVRALTE